MRHASTTIPPSIPMVVQIGFAGSRLLFDAKQHPDLDADAIALQILAKLIDYLHQLPQTLGLSAHHFLCGTSQIAIGADTVFALACKALAIPQRVLLPQPRNAYLEAISSDGLPDFDAAQRLVARELLASRHVIEERIVSSADQRRDRFEDTNLAILQSSDLLVCLERERPDQKPGGTGTLIDRAITLGKPVLAITVSIIEGNAVLSPLLPLERWTNGSGYAVPGMPRELNGLRMDAPSQRGEGLPTAADFIQRIKSFASDRSKAHSGWFKRAAVIIIAVHVIATFLAIFAAKIHEPGLHESVILKTLLAFELIFLLIGLTTHWGLHRTGAVRTWAVTRLVAETMRSVGAAEASGSDLTYPLALAYDDAFLPLLHTCAVLHCHDTRAYDTGSVATSHSDAIAKDRRKHYLQHRINDRAKGQVSYYRNEADKAAGRLKFANWLFRACSVGAIGAAATELIVDTVTSPVVLMPTQTMISVSSSALSIMAIGLPVAAVSFLSWAAASDLEARAKTFAHMLAFLQKKARQLRGAQTDREFDQIVQETESRLLSENLHWFSRRSFIGVA